MSPISLLFLFQLDRPFDFRLPGIYYPQGMALFLLPRHGVVTANHSVLTTQADLPHFLVASLSRDDTEG